MARIPVRRIAAGVVGMYAAALAGCSHDQPPDAYGNVEATEVIVSARGAGQLLSFTAVEGERLAAGAVVGLVDTTQLALQTDQLVAQRAASASRVTEASQQIDVLQVQLVIAERAYARIKRLFAEQAATAQQLDQAERDYRVLGQQIAVARAQRQTATKDLPVTDARVAQIRDQLDKSRVTNPSGGTVLTTYAKAGEFVQLGQPLYKLADLDTVELRAYVSEPQLSQVRVGQQATVSVDGGSGQRRALTGVVSWTSSQAEFTPTPIETRDERTNLVYAIKLRVPNPNGLLKIGMPADVQFVPRAASR